MITKDEKILHVHNEDSDQTAQMQTWAHMSEGTLRLNFHYLNCLENFYVT